MAFNGIAQEIKTKAVLEKNQALIGDQVKMSISVIKPKNALVFLPEFEPKLTDTIEIIEQFKPDTSILEDGNMLIEKSIIITAFDSGSYIIAPIPVFVKNNDKLDTLYTNALTFIVNSIPLDTTNTIKDIKLPYSAPVTFREALPYILGGLGILFIILLIVYIIIKLKRKEPIFKRFKPLEPAHIIAFRDLEKLKNDKLLQNDKIKDYYTRITDILRHYLWNRYAIRSMERTSDEILQSLKESEFSDEKSFAILKDILVTSDLVKFAKFKPQVDEHEKCFNGAFKFVDNTKLIIIENAEETESSLKSEQVNKSEVVNTEIKEKID
ncbi:MAG: hypothetical protein A2W99_01695 [Bacteroidetes bacterium GWF2_33_16]|nr:MAG: hypothetical protein A2X00_16460 [Bacteroidetes bacterium GWE2_32_14]OFY06983.1 MAG: hypothetical protein A2W99_01695 [Bacteroidetes bacterium GWF2_33_16]